MTTGRTRIGSSRPFCRLSKDQTEVKAGAARPRLIIRYRRTSTGCCLPSEESQYLAGDVTRILVRRKEDKCRRDLLGLTGPLHRRVLAMLCDLLRRFVRDIERRPDRSG